MSKDEQSAIGRFNRAKQEREAAFKRGSLSDAEKSNIMALSQPGLAFWASKGFGHSTAETACKSQGSTSWSASLVMRELLHPKNQIYLTGDTHGQFERIISSCERQQVQPESTFIILGDVGLNYSSMTSAMVWSASCCTSLILKRKRRSWTSGYIESHFNMTRMMKRSC